MIHIQIQTGNTWINLSYYCQTNWDIFLDLSTLIFIGTEQLQTNFREMFQKYRWCPTNSVWNKSGSAAVIVVEVPSYYHSEDMNNLENASKRMVKLYFCAKYPKPSCSLCLFCHVLTFYNIWPLPGKAHSITIICAFVLATTNYSALLVQFHAEDYQRKFKKCWWFIWKCCYMQMTTVIYTSFLCLLPHLWFQTPLEL